MAVTGAATAVHHPFKDRGVLAVGGTRVIGFDNARGKGDHSHIQAQERPYRFTRVDLWMAVETRA